MILIVEFIDISNPDDSEIRYQLDELIQQSMRDYEEQLRNDLTSKLRRMLQHEVARGTRGYIEAQFQIRHKVRNSNHEAYRFPSPHNRQREQEPIRRSNFGERPGIPPRTATF